MGPSISNAERARLFALSAMNHPIIVGGSQLDLSIPQGSINGGIFSMEDNPFLLSNRWWRD